MLEIQNRLQQMSIADVVQEGDKGAVGEKAGVLQQIGEEQVALNANWQRPKNGPESVSQTSA